MEDFVEFARCMRLAYESCQVVAPVPIWFGKPLVKAKLANLGYKEKPIIETQFMLDKIQIAPEKPFEEIREGMAEVESGIFKKILAQGYGDVIKENFEISVQYSIFMEGQNIAQDSTYIAQEPYTFVLGKEQGILPKFEAAVRTMSNQEKAEFIIPKILYQNDGKTPAQVEPVEQKTGYLWLEVIKVADVVGKQDKACVLNNLGMTLKRAQELRERAKAAFVARFYPVAVHEYTEAIFLLRNVLVQRPIDNEKRLELLLRMYLNAGVTYNKMEQPNLAYIMLKRAVDLIEHNVNAVSMLKGKVYLHITRALRLTNDHCKAFIYYARAKNCLGDVQEIKDEYKILKVAFEQQMTENFLVEGLSDVIEPTCGKHEIPAKDHDVFKAAFQQMLQTFKSSKEKKMTIYGVQGDECINVALKVANKNKVGLNVEKHDQGTIRYTLTRK